MTGMDCAPLLDFLESSMTRRGWLGRMFGIRQWLRGGSLSSTRATPISVVMTRRHARPGDASCALVELLRTADVPFQGILVDVVQEGDAQPGMPDCGADVHLVLAASTPWYTAVNVGAACTTGELLVFLPGTSRPRSGLLAAYRDVFSAHPATLAARGVLQVPGLDDCACQCMGSFILAEDTEFWPLDLDENMAIRAETFFALGGLDESLIGGYGALDFSVRLFGHKPDFCCQRYVHQAQVAVDTPEDSNLPLEDWLIQRQRAWVQLNDSFNHSLELYAQFWDGHTKGGNSE